MKESTLAFAAAGSLTWLTAINFNTLASYALPTAGAVYVLYTRGGPQATAYVAGVAITVSLALMFFEYGRSNPK